MAFDGPHVGKSGKHYYNPSVMEAHESEPEQEGGGGGHHSFHVFHHPVHGTHSVHHHDGGTDHADHASPDEAMDHGKQVMGVGESQAEEQAEERISPGIHQKVRRTESGAY